MSRTNVKSRLPWVVRDLSRVISANRRTLAAGLPALLAGGTAVALALHTWLTPADQVLTRYYQKAVQFAGERNFDAALACFNRLIRDRGPLPPLRYRQALILQQRDGKGDRAMASAILAQIAPVGRPGYFPAHMNIAQSILNTGKLSPPDVRTVERHLRNALDGPESESKVEANALLGQLLVWTNRSDQAEPFLLKATETHPDFYLVLASLAKNRGETHNFQKYLDEATREFQRKAEANPDDALSRLLWAGTTFLREDFPTTVTILEKGIKLTGDPRYAAMLGQVFGAWSDSLGRDAKSSRGDQLALLERGLRYDPKNVDLHNRLLRFVQPGSAEAEHVRTTLLGLLAEGKASAWVHFVLGVDATNQQRTDDARLHWEQAFRLDPGLAVVANNLAWVLAHSTPPDLNRALDLANRAVERQPNDARMRGTRGVVLMKLGRWSEALTDLEADLGADPENPLTHQRLAEVYDHLGSPEMASRHRARAGSKDKVEAKEKGPAESKAGGPKG